MFLFCWSTRRIIGEGGTVLMRNQLSLKIGLLFFIVIITVEIILFSILYTNLVNDRVDEVMGDLLARGNTHRDVLEENYTSTTLGSCRHHGIRI